MKYSIVFSSNTGNTARLAEEVRTVLPQEDCVYFGTAEEAIIDVPLLLIGFWTDKGTCDATTSHFLKRLKNKQVFLFGTAGFGEEASYFNHILEVTSHNLDSSNQIVGCFMCQGKMPISVCQRYEKMLTGGAEDKEVKALITNFHNAEQHPNQKDLELLKVKILETECAKEKYATEVKERWGNTEAYAQSKKRTASYKKEEWEQLWNKGSDILKAFSNHVGQEPESAEVQLLVEQWRDFIHITFYDCTKEILKGLGEMYLYDERFKENINQNGEGTAELLSAAIAVYCAK